jgi:predicted aldo/keto reductase-like oxidoreductase
MEIVLGGGNFHLKTQSEVNMIIGTAIDQGLTGIDTSPSYGDSQYKIGEAIGRGNLDNLKISTKLGWPPKELTPRKFDSIFQKSLIELRVDSVDTLYLHSTPKELISREVVSSLLDLKRKYGIKTLGYSGDGQDLFGAIDKGVFDAFMATFNLIDQGNQSLTSVQKNVSLKRVLANGITSLTLMKRVKKHHLRRLPPDIREYARRLNLMNQRTESSMPITTDTFLSFAKAQTWASKLTIGVSRKEQIHQIVNCPTMGIEEVRRFEAIFLELSHGQWESFT